MRRKYHCLGASANPKTPFFTRKRLPGRQDFTLGPDSGVWTYNSLETYGSPFRKAERTSAETSRHDGFEAAKRKRICCAILLPVGASRLSSAFKFARSLYPGSTSRAEASRGRGFAAVLKPADLSVSTHRNLRTQSSLSSVFKRFQTSSASSPMISSTASFVTHCC